MYPSLKTTSRLTAASLAFAAFAFPQSDGVKFERVSIEHGLSQIAVYAILQDHRGFLWFGTRDGLNKYDGYNFTVYRNRPFDSTSLSDNWVRALCEDKLSNLWVGANGGLNKLDLKTERFTRYLHGSNRDNSLRDNRVLSILEDHAGAIWIGTSEGGLSKLNPHAGKFTHYTSDPQSPNSLSSNHVRALHQDQQGMLWIGTDKGLDVFDPHVEKLTHYRRAPGDPHSLSHDYVVAICEDSSGAIWIGTQGGGLNKFDRRTKKFSHYRHAPNNPNSLNDNRVSCLWQDRSGKLWIGTLAGGLNQFDPETGRFVHYKNDPFSSSSLSQNTVWSIHEDRSGCLWIGTVGGGLNKIAPRTKNFRHYTNDPNNPHSLSSRYVRAIHQDHLGSIWIGTYGGGLNQFDRQTGRFTVYKNDPKNPRSLSHNVVYALVEDRHGSLWIGTRSGLNRFDRKTETFAHFRSDSTNPNGLSDDDINALYKDRDGVLWIGTTFGGLNKLVVQERSVASFESYQHEAGNPHSLSHNFVSTIFEDRSGNLWIGTDGGGLNRFDRQTKTFKRYKNDPANPNSLSHNTVRAIYEDSSGTIWIGASQGLNKLDPIMERFTQYFEKDGLPNEVIYGILGDGRGNLWLSTNKGIAKFNDRLPEGKKFRNYDVSDGLQSNEFNTGAYYKSKSGEMFFGGVNGFNSFYPDEIRNNPFPPAVALTAFRKFDKVIELDTAISEIKALRLSYQENFFSFEFAALDYAAPGKNRYAYKLEGFDGDWIEAGARRYASYTRLDGGEYTFKVKAANNDGVWNEEGAAVKVVIAPPFWKTAWFQILAAASFAGLLMLAYHHRVARLKKEKLAQEEFSKKLIEFQEGERKRIAGELHDGLGQDLLILNNGIRQCLNSLDAESEAAGELRQLSEIAVQSINDVREISYDLHPHQLDRLGLRKAIASIVHKFSQVSQIEFSSEIADVDGLFPKDMEINVYRIIQEGLSNVVKHAAATEAIVHVGKTNAQVNILIKDNGRGFAVDAGSSAPAAGAGFGLISISERVKLLKGKSAVSSAPGKGTELRIQIPLPPRPQPNKFMQKTFK
jgi:ligand-binding sensor domain-containing protein/signal transduction histidine kinase